ncbi:MAG TPA: hypothetical protein DC034_10975 [Clostridium sp.]|uniref:Uncharacterized protein n=1 Tax=Clostridium lapidicellarium TaxID=3240931 RepID=A0ABV4DV27_9CLOT|nr:hypothetical protein [Clostridiales bacterium]HBC97300.1 hypothetical protein [Clostridium sp.]
MKRSRNDADDLVQIALYMLPKYIKRIERYDKRYYGDSHHHDGSHRYRDHDEYADLKDLIGFIEKNIINDRDKGNVQGKKTAGENSKNMNKGPITGEIQKKVWEQIEKMDQDDEVQDNKNSIDTENVKQEDLQGNDKLLPKNESFSVCGGEIKNLLNKFVDKKVDLSVEGVDSCNFEQLDLICADENLAEFKNVKGEIVLVPVKNIVGMILPEPVSISESFTEDDMTNCCPLEKSFQNYFSELVGKRVSMQTQGQGKFRYLSDRVVTGTGKGFVIVEDKTVILFCKIVFVKEPRLDGCKNS